ncbi:hypothetical protein SB6415_04865 [Klebsiella pasteurii]|uniref:Uncharacterized protein n=2 Tax=Klebsiella TaxID=570 RepID=A0A9Q9UML3_9ENTR|nr:hypothetical protein EGY08_11340 [Klebsiella sp. FDAARGOS_511]MDR6618335.1 hypothetical protein [Klebsiella sp. 1400]OVU37405.1 hypothetical protein BME18_09075 [Klebsiella michiganensis]VUS49635.1 hypothetical protein SB6423_05250 [Klebsiella pasteurii]VUT05736.1 hypothetical protein SPARK1531C2_04570 [Klebsiella grimontii]
MNTKSFFFIFFYLFFACNVAMIVLFLLLYVLIRGYLLLMYHIPFELAWSDLGKYTKAACFTGSLIATGCWWIYYQHSKKGRYK